MTMLKSFDMRLLEVTGRPRLDFENLDFKIAGRLRNTLTGNCLKMAPQQKAKLNQRRDHVQAESLLG